MHRNMLGTCIRNVMPRLTFDFWAHLHIILQTNAPPKVKYQYNEAMIYIGVRPTTCKTYLQHGQDNFV